MYVKETASNCVTVLQVGCCIGVGSFSILGGGGGGGGQISEANFNIGGWGCQMDIHACMHTHMYAHMQTHVHAVKC